MLADQRRKPFAALPEVDRLGGDQHAYTRGDRDHASAVVTARKMSSKVASSIPGGTRTVTAPITISAHGELPQRVGAIGMPARDPDVSNTTGAKAIPLSPVRARCTSRRQVNNCWGVSPCRRATALTVSPAWYVSETISALLGRPAPPAPSPCEHLDPANRSRLLSGLTFKQKLSVGHMSKPSATQGRTIADQVKPIKVRAKDR